MKRISETICMESCTSSSTDHTHRRVGNAEEIYRRYNFSGWCGWRHAEVIVRNPSVASKIRLPVDALSQIDPFHTIRPVRAMLWPFTLTLSLSLRYDNSSQTSSIIIHRDFPRFSRILLSRVPKTRLCMFMWLLSHTRHPWWSKTFLINCLNLFSINVNREYLRTLKIKNRVLVL